MLVAAFFRARISHSHLQFKCVLRCKYRRYASLAAHGIYVAGCDVRHQTCTCTCPAHDSFDVPSWEHGRLRPTTYDIRTMCERVCSMRVIYSSSSLRLRFLQRGNLPLHLLLLPLKLLHVTLKTFTARAEGGRIHAEQQERDAACRQRVNAREGRHCATHMSFLMNSTRLVTLFFTSMSSCFTSTGPISLKTLASSSRISSSCPPHGTWTLSR